MPWTYLVLRHAYFAINAHNIASISSCAIWHHLFTTDNEDCIMCTDVLIRVLLKKQSAADPAARPPGLRADLDFNGGI